jgi:transcriptional regulator with XRE-family HTH domain
MLRELRRSALLTQEELAAASGVSVGTVAGLESGRIRRPRLATVRLLADALDLSLPQRIAMAAAVGAGPETAPGPAVPGSVRAAQLPADVAGFAGRTVELARLDEAAAGTERVSICTITGPAGVGKTALALHWSHRAAGRFPDGQLFVDLQGFGPRAAMSSARAVQGFLDALGTPRGRDPGLPEVQASRFRSLLAGRRVLVVLDNAREADQVRPLVPGTPGCLVLVTSRDRLTGLVAAQGARAVVLEPVTAAEARQVLAARLGADRVAAEPHAVDEVVARCGRLPLALAVVAARAATNPRLTLAALAVELRRAAGGLDALACGDAVTDARTALSWSYGALTPPACRLFRALAPGGSDVAAERAARLAGLPVAEVRPLLAELAQVNLVSEVSPGRYRLARLEQAYAAELTEVSRAARTGRS